MIITYELDLNSFKAWSDAVDTLDRIQREDKCEELENILEDLYPDGMTEAELNDLLWFDSEAVYEWLGIRSETKVREEMKEAEEELAKMESWLKEDLDDEDLTEEERADKARKTAKTIMYILSAIIFSGITLFFIIGTWKISDLTNASLAQSYIYVGVVSALCLILTIVSIVKRVNFYVSKISEKIYDYWYSKHIKQNYELFDI